MPLLTSENQADILRACLHLLEEGREVGVNALAIFLNRPEVEIERGVEALVATGHLEGGCQLTEAGRRQALALTRAHRLLESYLQSRDGVPLEQIHGEADRLEHRVSALEIERIAEVLNHPRFDPHGDPIPTRSGVLPNIRRVPLPEWPENREGRIAHIEDEPVESCRELVALGVSRGARIRILRPGVLWHHGRHLEVPESLWPLIGIEPLADGERLARDGRALTEFADGEAAEIIELDPSCTGAARHRMLDIGLVPGTKVVPDFSAAFGGPRMYRVRGTCVALRREQTNGILAKSWEEPS